MEPLLAQLKQDFKNASAEVHKVIKGQEELLKFINIAILSGGHTLITGVPGLAKTLAVKAAAKVLGMENARIQFTPDLLPGDIVGVEILDLDPETQQKKFKYIKGPVFTNILLADEINRATPRTQSALLEAMQEKSVTLGGALYALEPPFIVFATRNPIDYEGVYPLPEAQLDRFLMEIVVPYPPFEIEMAIAAKDYAGDLDQVATVITKEDLLRYQCIVDDVPVPETVMQKALTWIRNTRPDEPTATAEIREFIEWGAGSRAAYHLIHAARTHAILYGEGVVTQKDIAAVFHHVIRHRIVPSAVFNRTGKGVDELIAKIIIDA